MFLDNLKIGVRLSLGFLVILALTLAVGGGAIRRGDDRGDLRGGERRGLRRSAGSRGMRCTSSKGEQERRGERMCARNSSVVRKHGLIRVEFHKDANRTRTVSQFTGCKLYA